MERAKGVLNDEIAAEQARYAQLEASVAQKTTTDYLIQKAQDYDFVKQGEGLIAVERSEPSIEHAACQTAGERAVSRAGSSSSSESAEPERDRMNIAGWSSGSSSGS